jgi:hypothetical protein
VIVILDVKTTATGAYVGLVTVIPRKARSHDSLKIGFKWNGWKERMIHFSFFSDEAYDTVVRTLKRLNLGRLYRVTESDYYTAYYFELTYPPLLEEMRAEYGESKLIYGENECGYPLYWDVWW